MKTMKQLTKRKATIALAMMLMVSASTPLQAQRTKVVTKGVNASSLAGKAAAGAVKGIEAQQRINRTYPKPQVFHPTPKLNTPVPALPRNSAKPVKAPTKGKKKNIERPKRPK